MSSVLRCPWCGIVYGLPLVKQRDVCPRLQKLSANNCIPPLLQVVKWLRARLSIPLHDYYLNIGSLGSPTDEVGHEVEDVVVFEHVEGAGEAEFVADDARVGAAAAFAVEEMWFRRACRGRLFR